MKFSLEPFHLSYFKDHGKISFENFPFNRESFQQALEQATSARDLWRGSPFLQTLLLRKIAPLVLQLLGKKAIRLLADHRFPPSFSFRGPMENLFGFQPQACIALVAKESVSLYHPSMFLPENAPYLAVFGVENSRYVKRESDPANPFLKQQWGYAFGDLLKNETHPLVYA